MFYQKLWADGLQSRGSHQGILHRGKTVTVLQKKQCKKKHRESKGVPSPPWVGRAVSVTWSSSSNLAWAELWVRAFNPSDVQRVLFPGSTVLRTGHANKTWYIRRAWCKSLFISSCRQSEQGGCYVSCSSHLGMWGCSMLFVGERDLCQALCSGMGRLTALT